MSSKNIKQPNKTKLFIGIMYSDKKILDDVLKILVKKYGKITSILKEYSFSKITPYYDAEMDGKIMKKIFVFNFIRPEQIAEIKLFTNRIEEKFVKKGNRMINIDPGYFTITNVVLPTTKNFTHRIYMKKGIYVEMTALFKKTGIETFEWTYPDFRTELVKEFFWNERMKLLLEKK